MKNLKILPLHSKRKKETTYEYLKNEMLDSIFIQSSVAFHTFAEDRDEWARRWAHPEGFHVVDLHRPTDIDLLAELETFGANLFLFTTSLSNPVSGFLREPLLHTKLILFEKKDSISIYTGSANFTNFAMLGINLESGVLLEFDKNDSFPIEIKAELQYFRSFSERFDRTKIDEYKRLQGGSERSSLVIAVRSYEYANLENREICIFLEDENDQNDLKEVKTHIFVQAIDPKSESIAIYEDCEIISNVVVNRGQDNTNVSYSGGLTGFRAYGSIPELHQEDSHSAITKYISTSSFYVKIKMGQLIKKFAEFREPRRKGDVWQEYFLEASGSPLWFSDQAKELLSKELFKLRIPKSDKASYEIFDKRKIEEDSKDKKLKFVEKKVLREKI